MYHVTSVVFYYLWYHFIKIWNFSILLAKRQMGPLRRIDPTTNRFKGWYAIDWAISRSLPLGYNA